MPEIDRGLARKLDALNFFLADVRDGLGPYLAVYLLAVQQWDEASIGIVMSIGGVAAIVAQTPAGAIIDASGHKRTLLIAAAIAVTIGSLILPFTSDFTTVAIANAFTGAAGSLFAPGIAALTLGIVGPKAFAPRIGRNEAYNHAGNATAAAIAAVTAYFFGPAVVFWLMAVLAVASVVTLVAIPADAVDDDLARGLDHASGASTAGPSGFQSLLASRPLLIFAAAAIIFHFANAAMLPLVGQKLALTNKDLATSLMAICIIAAQAVMVPVAVIVGRNVDTWGRKPIFLVAFAILAIRGFLYPVSDHPAWLVGVQMLDGVGAGIFGALFPIIVADLTQGTGRFYISQGAIATAQGIGAAISTTFAGLIVVNASYGAAFIALACVAAIGFVGYLILMPETLNRTLASVRTADGSAGAER